MCVRVCVCIEPFLCLDLRQKILSASLEFLKLWVSLGPTVRWLPCDLEVIGSNPKNNLSASRDTTTYIYPTYIPPNGSFVHWVVLEFLKLYHVVIIDIYSDSGFEGKEFGYYA